jgi:uncharacterized membrane protein YfbV (UPF0208 family)
MNLWDGLAVLGACVSITFCGWCVLVAYQTLQQFEEVEHKPLPEVYDIPNWDKLNPVGKMANKELKKMYKGKMKGELV